MEQLNLIPVNQELVQSLTDELSRNRMFSSVDQFISMFNTEILSPRNELVKNTAEKIEQTFKNVSLVNNKLIIESPEEVACQNSILLLQNWLVVSKLKRFANTLFEEEYPIDTKIVFSEDKNGYPQIELSTGELYKHWSADRVVTRNSELAQNIFTQNLLQNYNDEGTACFFKIEDLIDIQDGFIKDIERSLLENTFKN